MTYFLMLVFVFWTLFMLRNIYTGVCLKLGASSNSYFDPIMAYTWAALGTIFFHSVW